MTGRITALTDTHATLDGIAHPYSPHVRGTIRRVGMVGA